MSVLLIQSTGFVAYESDLSISYGDFLSSQWQVIPDVIHKSIKLSFFVTTKRRSSYHEVILLELGGYLVLKQRG